MNPFMLKKRSWTAFFLLILLELLRSPAADASVQPSSRIQNAPYEDADPWGAEDASSEDDQPRIPEPMVFDLMRPLGSHQGEFEANVLGLIPVASRGGANGNPDALGLPGNGFEWAPELEYALMDGLTMELELPFERSEVAAYKGGAQWTFGKAFGNRFIHGAQLIIEYERQPARWLPVLTYLAGLRIDRIWSVFGMFGFRGVTNPEHSGEELDGILNLSVFADVAPQLTVGVETNLAESLSGRTNWLLMPEVHWEISDHFMFQGGIGARITDKNTLAEASIRLIHSY